MIASLTCCSSTSDQRERDLAKAEDGEQGRRKRARLGADRRMTAAVTKGHDEGAPSRAQRTVPFRQRSEPRSPRAAQ